ncbi:MAG TPA: hypothetical protein VJT84_10880 [Gaiellaceae bacterium]|nr:hypothetical protein [Gaiellaceae bacterium]
MRWATVGSVLVAAAVVCGTALGVGPWPGLARWVDGPSGTRYVAKAAAGETTVRAIKNGAVLASATLDGAYGIPAVTSVGLGGGLSPDGRLLVLAEPPQYEGLRDQSSFVLLSTPGLSRLGTIRLRGEFGFDAISPDRRTLYLIQHVSSSDLVRYVVRAYDLRARRLVPGAIVDKREPSEAMRGYPVARAASQRGAWVYTLYNRPSENELPFVHALNAARRIAFCIDLPRWPQGADIWSGRLQLSADGRELVVRAPESVVARIDTKSLAVR